MKKEVLAITLIALGFGSAVLAQDGAGAAITPEADDLAVLPGFKSVDANQDGMIDKAEGEALTKVLQAEYQVEFQFDSADKSHNGLIDAQEYIAYDLMLKERLGIA